MNKNAYLTQSIVLLIASLAVGCGDDGSGTPSVESELIGVYEIDSYQASPLDPDTGEPVPDSCDQLDDAPAFGAFLVIYSFQPNDRLDEAGLAGVFCADVDNCRAIANAAPEPTIGYSFIQGSDETGWTGFGNARQGSIGDECLIDLQTHELTSAGDSIEIITDTVQVLFEAEVVGNDATCSVAEALRVFNSNPDLPCRSRIALEATRAANL